MLSHLRYGWTDTVEALMDNQNAKIINMQNSQGKTALHFACSEGHDYTAETLLRLGAVIERYIKILYLFELSNLIAVAGDYLIFQKILDSESIS